MAKSDDTFIGALQVKTWFVKSYVSQFHATIVFLRIQLALRQQSDDREAFPGQNTISELRAE